MKNQTKLVLVSLIFSLMAACGDSKVDTSPTSGRSERTTGGGCSTEAEFRDIIIDKNSNTISGMGQFKETEVIFKTFSVGAATRYRNAQYSIDAYPAYPVETDFTVRDFLGSEDREGSYIREADHSVSYICYVDIYDKCVCNDERRSVSEPRRIPYNR